MVRLASQLAIAASIVSIVSAAPAAQSKNFIAVPIQKRTSGASFTAKDVVERDLARIAAYNGKSSTLAARDESSGGATNRDVTYTAAVTFCGTTYNLIVDTGSSNTWAGAGTQSPSSCGTSAGGTFAVTYGSGSVAGNERIGSVSYAGLTVPSQSFGAATTSSGFNIAGVDGILGVGPVDLTQGTVSNANTVPTFMDNLKSQGSIPDEVLGVYFHPESGSDTDDANGELTLGGVDTSKYTGTLTYFPKSTTSPYSNYWGISSITLKYNNQILISLGRSAIVDTGTTLIYIPTLAYEQFLLYTGGSTDSSSGLARFNTAPTGTFTFTIASTSYTLTPAQYLVPQAQYAYYGLDSSYSYAFINSGGTILSGVDFIVGQKFLENFYSVFDTTNSRIGFATRT